MEPELALIGRIVTTAGVMELAVLSDGEKVIDLATPGRIPHGTRVVDRSRYLIFPGFVDIHVHCRDLGQSAKEDWFSCTSSAAAGGVTTIFDMPNTVPPTKTYSALQEKLRAASSRAVVDYGLHLGLPEEEGLWEKARGLGIRSVKFYPEDYAGGLKNSLERVPEDFLPVIHAEDPGILSGKEALSLDPGTYAYSRPPEAEVRAVREALGSGKRVHITHVSTSGALDILASSGTSFDVTPHHALLDADSMLDLGNVGKVRPPLRPSEHRRAVFSALISGLVPAVSSDHAPHGNGEKLDSSFAEAPAGFPGLETTSHLLLTLSLRDGLLRPRDLLRLYSLQPARIMGLRRKGMLGRGFHLDFAVVDTRTRWRIRGDRFLSKAKYTPFEGWEVWGKVVETAVRGETVFTEGEVKVVGGFGEMVE